ncbi:apolipoprotein N-acyltransferase [Aliidiomarina indica]|uniref:apolipoprotein N-acyltransferase n=1 Tax=Aliidiomarina indica TaxID=2749147 RepID=UPI00188F4945|nr:apolipoprotein N-acyltransferase [Aliidiomarina indica]
MLQYVARLLQSQRWRSVFSFALGLVLVFAYAPFSQPWLTPLVMAAWLLLVVRSQHWRQAAATGFWFGLGWFGAGISWVFVSIDQFGGMPLIASIFVMVLLCAYLALFPTLVAVLWLRCRPYFMGLSLFAIPFIWLVAEFLRGWLFTGFPWLSLGYTQTTSVLGNFAPHIGELGIVVVLWLMAVCIAYTVLRRQLQWLLAVPALLVLGVAAPSINPMEATGEHRQVALVQGNVIQDLKWNPDEQWPNFHTYLDLTAPYLDHDLVIWPESAITFIEPFAQRQLADLDDYLREQNTTLISGIIDLDRNTGDFFNSMIVLGEQSGRHWYHGHPNRYQKHQLLPIGEFVPFESLLRPLAPLFNLPMSSFSRGDFIQNNLNANGVLVAANICYEVVFSRQIRANFSDETGLLLTISNDTWFGDSHGPHQHMEIARMRARELGRPMLRATNNGITGIYDEQGHTITRIPQFEPGIASARVMLVSGATGYARWGDLPAWGFVLLLLALARPWKFRHSA